MTIQFIKKDKYHIDFTCNESAKSDGLSIDIKKVLSEYLNEFFSVIKSEIWDHFAVEFWFDCGKLIFFPEKKLDEISTEYDPFPADRLDPYLVVRLTSYLEIYNIFIDNNYYTISENEFEEWCFKNCTEVFNSVSIALSDYRLSSFILNSLNKEIIVFRYFGSSRETEYGGKQLYHTKS